MPIKAILGLSDSADTDWTRLRGLQLSTVGHHARIRMAAHLILGLITVWTFQGSFNIVGLLMWFAALASLHIRGGLADQKLVHAERKRMSNREFQRHLVTPVGSVSFEYAVPMEPTYGTDPTGRFHFNFGFIF